MVVPPGSGAWLKLDNDRRVTVHRKQLDGLASVDLALALASNLGLTEALKRALSRTTLAAPFGLLDPVWRSGDPSLSGTPTDKAAISAESASGSN